MIVRNDGQVWIPSGNVGIGTTSPARPLSVNSSQISARFTSSSADSQIEIVDSSGTVVFGSSSTIITSLFYWSYAEQVPRNGPVRCCCIQYKGPDPQ